ncbi:DUF4157 domain-containing protein [Moorena sp. SIO4E2]|uniref:eCIS core domain-containing protein n=2 Tax=unclassified Moorena TaxID=2683338 RepID=UPI00257B204B|nr:DUF4157 domain-containing protein [Moorena sp. SIO4E2]
MRTTHTYKPKYSHSTSRTNAQKKKDSRVMGSRRRHEEDRDWNAEEAVGEWGSRMANVMHSLETGQYVPDTEGREMGLQAKLTIGQPGDKYEQEADRVARQVVQQINSPQMGTIEGEEMRTPQHEIQRKALTGGTLAPQNLEGSIKEARGRGKPLEERIRIPLEQAMGADFSGVRVHTDAQSDLMNKSIQAKAFTTGQDVFFRKGEYEPGCRGGQELIAHELTHVRQQLRSVYPSEKIRESRAKEKKSITGSTGRERPVNNLQIEGSHGRGQKGVFRRKKEGSSGRLKVYRSMKISRPLLKYGIRIWDGKTIQKGLSGSQRETDKNLRLSPAIHKYFNSEIKAVTYTDKNGKKYQRRSIDCAEPAAFALLVEKWYNSDPSAKGNADWVPDSDKLSKTRFDPKAIDETDNNLELDYCKVCEQWINPNGTLKKEFIEKIKGDDPNPPQDVQS